MASKFQNRLVGTIVLVALGVIVLPGLLDGQKKHYQDEFAAIPLVPKAGDRDEPDMMPAATQALPTQPPEGAAEEVRAGDAAAPSLDPATIAANNTEFEPEPAPVAPPKPKPVEPPKPKVEAPPAPKPEPKPVVEEKAAPTGKAYVVQLGALKNADKVNEIVGKLRAAHEYISIRFGGCRHIWWVFTSSRPPFLPYLRLAIRQAIANEDSPHSRVSSRYESRSLGLPFSSRMGRPVYSLC